MLAQHCRQPCHQAYICPGAIPFDENDVGQQAADQPHSQVWVRLHSYKANTLPAQEHIHGFGHEPVDVNQKNTRWIHY